MNSIGKVFRVSIFGESHGINVGVTIDAPIAGMKISEEDLLPDLQRRKSGKRGTTPRKEADLPKIVSGHYSGYATGAPMTIVFENENTMSGDYKNLVAHPRPGHSDFVAYQKYKGFNDYRGGGHFSARVTLGIVAAGTIAKKLLSEAGVVIESEITEVGGECDPAKYDEIIEKALRSQDSVGAIVSCRVKSVPASLGEPFFDSAESLISHAIFSIPAVRGIEFGEGFNASRRMGSQHNDPILDIKGSTETNFAGGINGGITNGNDITFNVAFKPTSSISTPQNSYNRESDKVEELIIKGRHDACVALRAPVIVEAMTAIVLADLYLLKQRG